MTKRIRGRQLQTLRRRLFLTNPLCVLCERAGRLSVASELDHIVALVNGGGNGDENLQGLCASCHLDKTAVDLGQRVKPVIGLDGWPVVDA
jgi:5-methylcytosine-specific restriction protein A